MFATVKRFLGFDFTLLVIGELLKCRRDVTSVYSLLTPKSVFCYSNFLPTQPPGHVFVYTYVSLTRHSKSV
jgi:hypothetical protein